MLMKSFLRSAAFLLLVGHDVVAQSLPPVNLSPVVPSGAKRQLAFVSALNPDCSSAGEIEVRVIKSPKNGTVEIENGFGYPNYDEKNQRYSCNTRLVQGVRISYTSAEGFIGKDHFDLDLFALSADVIWKYSVTVK
jgi:hypothetical protein